VAKRDRKTKHIHNYGLVSLYLLLPRRFTLKPPPLCGVLAFCTTLWTSSSIGGDVQTDVPSGFTLPQSETALWSARFLYNTLDVLFYRG
jgi:hypothetical protein